MAAPGLSSIVGLSMTRAPLCEGNFWFLVFNLETCSNQGLDVNSIIVGSYLDTLGSNPGFLELLEAMSNITPVVYKSFLLEVLRKALV